VGSPLDLQAPNRPVNLGPVLTPAHTLYRLTWRIGSDPLLNSVNFRTSTPLFRPVALGRYPVTNFSTTDTRLAAAIASAGGAVFCVGAGLNT
jgi:hypothetical protein